MNGRSSVNGAGSINYKTGTPAPVPVAPAVDAGYIKIAEVLVGASVASILQNKITDLRPLAFPGGHCSIGVGADGNNFGIASGTGLVLQEIAAPAGVLVLPRGISGGTGQVFHVAVIAGDTSLFNIPNSIASCANAFQAAPNKLVNVNPTGAPTLAFASSGDQTIFNATTPSAQVAVGQPYLDFAFNVFTTDGSTGIANPSGNITNFRLNIHLSRN
jgi:hypothetical protein